MSDTKQKTILLVEDEALIALSEKLSLEQHGYHVLIASTGEKAIEIFRTDTSIDLILIDIDLGSGIDGTETAIAIQKQRAIPVVFLSSHTEPQIVEKTENITSYGYVVKNSGITVLVASIKMAFKLFEANRKLEEEKEHLKTTFNSIGDAVIATDIDGAVTRMNPVAEHLTGWKIEEAMGKPVAEVFTIINARTREPAENPVRLVIERGVIVGLANHTLLISKDGTEYQIADSGAPIKGFDQDITGVVLVFRDVTAEYKTQEELRESEATVRKKLAAILQPEGDIGLLNLADIIDYQALQTMMEDFYRLTNIGSAVLDISGKVLVAVGWQDICTKFHRVHPGTQKNCLESDVILSSDVPAGTFKTYRCKNNLWDMVTPIEVDGRHLGNIFFGQFFYEDEIPDRKLFSNMARRYEFDEKEYLAALDRVPRFSREKVDTAMTFYAKLAGMISSLSYSTIKLSRTLSQKDIANRQLAESEARYRSLYLSMNEGAALVLKEKELLLKEVHHRLKNYMNTISGLLTLQADSCKEPQVVEALRDAGSRMESMQVLYDKLYQTAGIDIISVRDYLSSLVDEIIGNFPNRQSVTIEKKIDDFILDAKRLQPLGIIINELLTNIMKHAFTGRDNGTIAVSASKSGNHVMLVIQDDGAGLSESINFENSTGFGFMLVRVLTQQLNGTVGIVREQGTKITLEFAI